MINDNWGGVPMSGSEDFVEFGSVEKSNIQRASNACSEALEKLSALHVVSRWDHGFRVSRHTMRFIATESIARLGESQNKLILGLEGCDGDYDWARLAKPIEAQLAEAIARIARAWDDYQDDEGDGCATMGNLSAAIGSARALI